jgi:hypothetical protein
MEKWLLEGISSQDLMGAILAVEIYRRVVWNCGSARDCGKLVNIERSSLDLRGQRWANMKLFNYTISWRHKLLAGQRIFSALHPIPCRSFVRDSPHFQPLDIFPATKVQIRGTSTANSGVEENDVPLLYPMRPLWLLNGSGGVVDHPVVDGRRRWNNASRESPANSHHGIAGLFLARKNDMRRGFGVNIK